MSINSFLQQLVPEEGVLRLITEYKISGADEEGLLQDKYVEVDHRDEVSLEPATDVKSGVRPQWVRDSTPLPQRRRYYQIDIDVSNETEIDFGCNPIVLPLRPSRKQRRRALISLSSKSVSQKHFNIVSKRGVSIVTDVGSKSGTVVEGERLQDIERRNSSHQSVVGERSLFRGSMTGSTNQDSMYNHSAVGSIFSDSFTRTSFTSLHFTDEFGRETKEKRSGTWGQPSMTLEPGRTNKIEAGDVTLYVGVAIPARWQQSLRLEDAISNKAFFQRSIHDFYHLNGRLALAKRHPTICEIHPIKRKDIEEWENYLEKVRKAGNPNVQEILAIYHEPPRVITRACLRATPLSAKLRILEKEDRLSAYIVSKLLWDAINGLIAIGRELPGGVDSNAVVVDESHHLFLKLIRPNSVIVASEFRAQAMEQDISNLLSLFGKCPLAKLDKDWEKFLNTKFKDLEQAKRAIPKLDYKFGALRLRRLLSSESTLNVRAPPLSGSNGTQNLIYKLRENRMIAYSRSGSTILSQALKAHNREVLSWTKHPGSHCVSLKNEEYVGLLRWRGRVLVRFSRVMLEAQVNQIQRFLKQYRSHDWVRVISEDERLCGLYADVNEGGWEMMESLGLEVTEEARHTAESETMDVHVDSEVEPIDLPQYIYHHPITRTLPYTNRHGRHLWQQKDIEGREIIENVLRLENLSLLVKGKTILTHLRELPKAEQEGKAWQEKMQEKMSRYKSDDDSLKFIFRRRKKFENLYVPKRPDDSNKSDNSNKNGNSNELDESNTLDEPDKLDESDDPCFPVNDGWIFEPRTTTPKLASSTSPKINRLPTEASLSDVDLSSHAYTTNEEPIAFGAETFNSKDRLRSSNTHYRRVSGDMSDGDAPPMKKRRDERV